MTYTQHISTCQAHRECTVITCTPDDDPDTVIWHSHLSSAIHPEHRINSGHAAFDHRGDYSEPVTWSAPCAQCAPLL